jgi:DNA ligase-1
MSSKDYIELFKKDTFGNTLIWIIELKKKETFTEIVISNGRVDGKINVRKGIKVSSGKNIGKANETNHYTQAQFEMQSKVNKKIKEGYSYSRNSVGAKKNKDKPKIKPMLAYEFNKEKYTDGTEYYIQPKFDGYRGVFTSGSFYSRSMSEKDRYIIIEEFKPELIEESKTILEGIDGCLGLDGELYSPELTFEDHGILKTKKFTNVTEEKLKNLKKMKYYIYDLIIPELNYSERLEILNNINKKTGDIVIVDKKMTYLINDYDSIIKNHESFIKKGFEGSMLRVPNSNYVFSRTRNLQKFKNFNDHEFTIVDCEKSKDNKIVFICKTKTGGIFKVDSIGTEKERKDSYNEFVNNKKKYVGKLLTVKFFGYTDEGIPRFPKALFKGLTGIGLKK